jgi:signal transduction histidine kinase
LRLRNQELDAFAHTVAHDLKASLATLIGYSEVLAETHTKLSEAERSEHLEALARNSRRMGNVIDELLMFASIRKEDVKQAPLQMNSIMERVLQRLNYVIKEAQAQIILPARYERAIGYAPWVEEVWYNYLTNAIKYGGKPPVIEIGSELEEDYVKFWVKDNGVGVPKNEQHVLFEPFAQLEIPRFEGHGLGLSIVKNIVEKLNGRVEAESEVGKGSVFSFYLSKDNVSNTLSDVG